MADAPELPVPMLRPALELAWAVAKVGSRARPPQPVPTRLRPFMQAKWLPDRMLSTVREVVEQDGTFRERVAAAADETVLGRASWLWLTRPEGWEGDLAELSSAADRADREAEEKKQLRDLQHRLDEAGTAVQQARAELVAARAQSSELETRVEDERRARRVAERQAGEARALLENALAGQEELRRTASDLAERLEASESRAAALAQREGEQSSELHSARRKVEVLQLALAEAQRRTTAADETAERLRSSLVHLHETVNLIAADAGVLPSRGTEERDGDTPVAAREDPVAQRPAEGGPGREPRRRRPLPLPPAVFDDSEEAAAHLVRSPGVTLTVDGYNVTLSSWPGMDLPSQRAKLVDALAELVMRSGTEVEVVFDGIDGGNRLQPPPAVRGRLRVRFSPSELEADEVIVGLVESLPPDRPAVVATNDRRVREEVARLGANVISVGQLLAVIGRGGHTPM